MKKQTKILITAATTVLVVLSVCFFAGKNNSESNEPMTVADVSIAATSIAEKETETEAIVVNSEEERTESEKQSIAESAIPDETVLNTSSNEETSAAETEKSSVENESRYQNSDKLEGATVTVSGLPETNTDEQGENDIKGNSTEGEKRDTSNSAIYGDTGEKYHYPCDESYYAPVIHSLCEPGWYSGESALDVYEQVFVLSDRYKKEHPFSAGSILKPYYPDIDDVYWFTGSFDKRYIVLEAYDTSHKGKFFLIEFTITDNYELDTVSIRELADDEIGK